MSLVTTDLNNINLDNYHFDEDDPETIVLGRLLVGVTDISNMKYEKKNIKNYCV